LLKSDQRKSCGCGGCREGGAVPAACLGWLSREQSFWIQDDSRDGSVWTQDRSVWTTGRLELRAGSVWTQDGIGTQGRTIDSKGAIYLRGWDVPILSTTRMFLATTLDLLEHRWGVLEYVENAPVPISLESTHHKAQQRSSSVSIGHDTLVYQRPARTLLSNVKNMVELVIGEDMTRLRKVGNQKYVRYAESIAACWSLAISAQRVPWDV
jgi:hypothetical protein